MVFYFHIRVIVYKKFSLAFLGIVSLLFGLGVLLGFILDGYGVFGRGGVFYNAYNERFIKIEFLKTHAFNSFLLGSSRVGYIPPSLIEKYIPHSKFYNLFVRSASVLEEELLMSYLVKHYKVKNLYIALDLDLMLYPFTNPLERRDLGGGWHYDVSQSSPLEYTFPYLVSPFNRGNRESIKTLLGWHNKEKISQILYTDTGTLFYPITENQKKVMGDDLYIKQTRSFHNPHPATKVAFEKNAKVLFETLSKMQNICKEYQINCIFVTNPNHARILEWIGKQDSFKLKRLISKALPNGFWDFAYLNSITTNSANYLETSHFIKEVHKLMLGRVFGDKNITVPEDFGIFITQENLEQSLAKIEQIQKNYPPTPKKE